MTQPGSAQPPNGEWECMECGYVEEGVQLERPQKCPECGATPESFEFFSYEEEEDVEDEWDEDDDELEDEDEELDDYDELDDDFEDDDGDEFDELDDER